MSSVIAVKDLSFSYTGTAPWLLENISFTVQEGDYVCLMGANGCGKTTLMKMILGFIEPGRGTVTVNAPLSGYVPQADPAAMSAFPITVSEVVKGYAALCRAGKDAAEHVLATVGMAAYRNALIGTLSGGQRQRVLIARALLAQRKLLLLDEPSTGLDKKSATDIYSLLKHLNVSHGVTVVSVEHNFEAVRENATKIVAFAEGHARTMTPDAYFDEKPWLE